MRTVLFDDGPRPRPGCNVCRDAAGFCHLTNRCWSGKPCPKSRAQADRAREELCDDLSRERAGVGG